VRGGSFEGDDMSAASQLVEKLLDVVVETDLDVPDQAFTDVAFSVLALAVSRLSAGEREATLLAIDNGALRQAVAQFPSADTPYPKATNGRANGHAS
jgi:hypothetical protein